MVRCIPDETVHLANACRLWLRALHIKDLLDGDNIANPDFLFGRKQCDTDLNFLQQLRPPIGYGAYGDKQYVWCAYIGRMI